MALEGGMMWYLCGEGGLFKCPLSSEGFCTMWNNQSWIFLHMHETKRRPTYVLCCSLCSLFITRALFTALWWGMTGSNQSYGFPNSSKHANVMLLCPNRTFLSFNLFLMSIWGCIWGHKMPVKLALVSVQTSEQKKIKCSLPLNQNRKTMSLHLETFTSSLVGKYNI